MQVDRGACCSETLPQPADSGLWYLGFSPISRDFKWPHEAAATAALFCQNKCVQEKHKYSAVKKYSSPLNLFPLCHVTMEVGGNIYLSNSLKETF